MLVYSFSIEEDTSVVILGEPISLLFNYLALGTFNYHSARSERKCCYFVKLALYTSSRNSARRLVFVFVLVIVCLLLSFKDSSMAQYSFALLTPPKCRWFHVYGIAYIHFSFLGFK